MIRIAKISCLVLLFALTSCYDEEQFPDTPKIEFESLEFVDTQTSDTLILKFHFEDGDANLGVPQNDFSSPYTLLVDTEPKILTEANIADAQPPIFFAPLILDDIVPLRLDDNTVTILPGSGSYPAFFTGEVYTDTPDTISLECPNLINQNLALFDTVDVSLYTLNGPLYEEVFRQNIDAVVPALYRESYFNLIIQFERIVNGAPQVIDFREEFSQTDCSVGSFNARIPLFDQDGRSGTITYNMISFLLRLGIGDDPFQVRFFVYDRAGNKSNEVVSPTFLMSEITRN